MYAVPVRALCAVGGCRGSWAAGQTAGQTAGSHSTHLLGLVSPGFGGPALTPLVSPCRAAAVLQDKGHGGEMQIPFAVPDGSHPDRPPRNQILLWEASGVLFHLGKRGLQCRDPINFQPLVRAVRLSRVGVLPEVNLSPLCTALICQSNRCPSGR